MKQIKGALVLIVALTATFPLMFWIPSIEAISIFCMFIWFVLNAFDKPRMHNRTNAVYYFFSMVFLAYISLVTYLAGNSTIGNRYLNLFAIPFFYIVYKENTDRSNFKLNIKVVIMIISLSAITFIKTVIEILNNPYIIRTIKSSGSYTLNTLREGIGGYSFLYFFIFVGIISFGILTGLKQFGGFRNKRVIKFILFIIIVSSIVLAILSNYLTAIFLMLLGIIPVFIVGLFKFKSKRIIICTLLALPILLMVWKKIASVVISALINIIGEGYTSERLSVFNDYFLYGSELVSITEDRNSRMDLSIESFLNNPLFGLVTTKIEYSNGYLTGFGQHSYILDTFALFGLFIGLLNLYLLIYPFAVRIKRSNNIIRFLNIIILALTLFFFFINNAVGSIGFAVYFMFPVLCDFLEKMMKKDELIVISKSKNENNPLSKRKI